MTRAQWLIEYYGYINRNKEEREFHLKSLKSTLVNILGLNIIPQFNEDGSSKEYDPEAFTPLAMVCGNHHLLKGYFDRLTKSQAPDGLTDANEVKISDAEFEAQAKLMMESGDMDPILPLDQTVEQIKDAVANKALGVTILEDIPVNQVTVEELDG